ncbi:hypothetical protein GR157_31950 [Burkholderia sp. 4701]|nr:hypothetical protein [Burkholderia sp. 4701]MXN86532.1 hypothetical protein [Burkholderia sp. 4812]
MRLGSVSKGILLRHAGGMAGCRASWARPVSGMTPADIIAPVEGAAQVVFWWTCIASAFVRVGPTFVALGCIVSPDLFLVV